MKFIRFIMAICFGIALVACGGSGGGSTPATYGISGTVTLSGAALAGATITLTGGTTATTDASGNYSFTGLDNGSYTVTPTKTGNAFNPSSLAVSVSGANVTGTNFAATPASTSYSISGAVSGATGVTLTLSGNNTGSVVAGTGGIYTLSGLVPGSYTVTPSLSGFTFSPTSTSVTLGTANSAANDFVATAIPVSHSLSGAVSGDTLSGVTITVTGTATAGATTDSSGNYSVTGVYDGSYTMTPSKTGYTFTPSSLAVTVSGVAVTGKNFVAISNAAPTYSISGAVSGAVQSGVTVTLSGVGSATTTSNGSGNYTFAGLINGSYTITPSMTGYTFSPTSSAITINGANSTANNFTSSTGSATTYLYSYYKRYGSTTPQTATLTNGTLSIDGKTLTGIRFTSYSGFNCLTGGDGTVLTACATPTTAPHTMLLCGPDPVTSAADTLLYVLFDTPDTNRVTSTSSALMTALQSETNYLGINVYTDCSGTWHTSWIRNYPATNYYLWPDVFTTYSDIYVSNLLSGAVIYSTPTAGTNYNDYVAVRLSSTVFEVWH